MPCYNYLHHLFHSYAARSAQINEADRRGRCELFEERGRSSSEPSKNCVCSAGWPASDRSSDDLGAAFRAHQRSSQSFRSFACCRPAAFSMQFRCQTPRSSSISRAARYPPLISGRGRQQFGQRVQCRRTRIIGVVDNREPFLESQYFAALVRRSECRENVFRFRRAYAPNARCREAQPARLITLCRPIKGKYSRVFPDGDIK